MSDHVNETLDVLERKQDAKTIERLSAEVSHQIGRADTALTYDTPCDLTEENEDRDYWRGWRDCYRSMAQALRGEKP